MRSGSGIFWASKFLLNPLFMVYLIYGAYAFSYLLWFMHTSYNWGHVQQSLICDTQTFNASKYNFT